MYYMNTIIFNITNNISYQKFFLRQKHSESLDMAEVNLVQIGILLMRCVLCVVQVLFSFLFFLRRIPFFKMMKYYHILINTRLFSELFFYSYAYESNSECSSFYSVIKISFIFISHKLDLTMLERIPGFQTQLLCLKYFVELSALMSKFKYEYLVQLK